MMDPEIDAFIEDTVVVNVGIGIVRIYRPEGYYKIGQVVEIEVDGIFPYLRVRRADGQETLELKVCAGL
jgi:hypothetical protein